MDKDFSKLKPYGNPDDIKPSERDETLQERFERERLEWVSIMKDLSGRIKDIDNLAELQVDVYSKRQELVEYYHFLMSTVNSKNMEIFKKKRRQLEFYTTNYDYKLTNDQKEMYIMVDFEELYKVRDEIENHMKYINQTINTIDNIIYGIKHRISIEEYRRRL